jgi:hypothetical protein
MSTAAPPQQQQQQRSLQVPSLTDSTWRSDGAPSDDRRHRRRASNSDLADGSAADTAADSTASHAAASPVAAAQVPSGRDGAPPPAQTFIRGKAKAPATVRTSTRNDDDVTIRSALEAARRNRADLVIQEAADSGGAEHSTGTADLSEPPLPSELLSASSSPSLSLANGGMF